VNNDRIDFLLFIGIALCMGAPLAAVSRLLF
jgi:hypothetical protein